MSGFNISLVHVFGPWVQFLFLLVLLLVVGTLVGAVSFWGECRLIRTKRRILWIIPFLVLTVCFIYGALRFSGLLLYATDGWDPSGIWNYTNQNQGMIVVFLCACLLIGAIFAVRREVKKICENTFV